MRGIALLLLLLLGAAPALGCGPDSDCLVGERSYRIRMPAEAAGPVGAILFLHGHRGHAADIMGDEALAAAVSGLGLALIAPQSAGPGWTMRRRAAQPAADAEVEPDYLDRVLADAAARFPLDRGRVMASGMSAGGMMVWYLACHRPAAYAGFAPVAGTFWREMPHDCRPPPRWLRHIHGRQDPTVPLEGRVLRDGIRQGDVFEAVAMFAAAGGFGPPRETVVDAQDCALRRNAAGDALELCLHDGAHDYRVADIVSAWRALAAFRGW
jgi:polyhydroxybutyrate depolymerase